MNMEHTDSTAAMASLASYSAVSDESDDDNDRVKQSAVDTISDDDAGTPTPTPNAVNLSQHSSRPPSRLIYDENDHSHSDSESTRDHDPKPKKRKRARLVSYGPDDLDDEEESSSSESGDSSSGDYNHGIVEGKIMSSSLNVEQASSLSRAMLNKSFDEIELPPEPPTKCSKQLQEKIAMLHERRKEEGLNLNKTIQSRVEFRNPSIYEKLIEFCGIDEKGTNYPPELFDPSVWGKESYYDALEKAQKADMEKREKDRKDRTKVEFVTATKKSGPKTEIISSEEMKRKSKWDDPSSQATSTLGKIGENINRNIMSTTTGTKSTVIPAVGNISKKVK